MSQGTVLCYSDTIGYFYIRPDDGGECTFVHRTKIASGEPEKLEQGDRVTYEETLLFERRWE
jgi:cold shock CspA family protein